MCIADMVYAHLAPHARSPGRPPERPRTTDSRILAYMPNDPVLKMLALAETVIVQNMTRIQESRRKETVIVVLDGRDAGARNIHKTLSKIAPPSAVPALPPDGWIATGGHISAIKAAARAAGYDLETQMDSVLPDGEYRVAIFTAGVGGVMAVPAPKSLTKGGSA